MHTKLERLLSKSLTKRRRVACQHFPDDQTLRLQAGAGEDDVIHLPSGLDRVDCERQEEEEEKKSLTTLEVMTYYLVMHTGPDGLIWPTLSSHWFVIIVISHNDKDNDTERRDSKICIFSSLGHGLSPTPTLNWPRLNGVKITCSTSGDHQVRHVVCHVVQKDSSAIKFD